MRINKQNKIDINVINLKTILKTNYFYSVLTHKYWQIKKSELR